MRPKLDIPLGRSTKVLGKNDISPVQLFYIPLWTSTKVLGHVKLPPPLDSILIVDFQWGFNSCTRVKLLHWLKIFEELNSPTTIKLLYLLKICNESWRSSKGLNSPTDFNFTFIEDLQKGFHSPTLVNFSTFMEDLLPAPSNFYIYWIFSLMMMMMMMMTTTTATTHVCIYSSHMTYMVDMRRMVCVRPQFHPCNNALAWELRFRLPCSQLPECFAPPGHTTRRAVIRSTANHDITKTFDGNRSDKCDDW